ncbi:MAG: hypothetical protein PQJ59_10560 [Spirochaetales bacterium]|nr:hypothetical protein [Spirochaetales bacterium]
MGLLFSCGQNPFKGYDSLKKDLKNLEEAVDFLRRNNLTADEIRDGLNEASLLVGQIQEARDGMAEEAERLTQESYELHSNRIDLLKEGRLELYEGMDDFLVCTYELSDTLKLSRYYHERSELTSLLREIQLRTLAMVQRDAPHSSTSNFSYYKNLSKITSQTADTDGHWYYTIKVNIGYNFNEKNTQTLLNNSKVAMGGVIRSYFSSHSKDEVLSQDEEWVKAGLVLALNDYLIQFADFKDKKMEGVKLVTFDIIQFYEFF